MGSHRSLAHISDHARPFTQLIAQNSGSLSMEILEVLSFAQSALSQLDTSTFLITASLGSVSK